VGKQNTEQRRTRASEGLQIPRTLAARLGALMSDPKTDDSTRRTITGEAEYWQQVFGGTPYGREFFVHVFAAARESIPKGHRRTLKASLNEVLLRVAPIDLDEEEMAAQAASISQDFVEVFTFPNGENSAPVRAALLSLTDTLLASPVGLYLAITLYRTLREVWQSNREDGHDAPDPLDLATCAAHRRLLNALDVANRRRISYPADGRAQFQR
jgi:hypothetical protein